MEFLKFVAGTYIVLFLLIILMGGFIPIKVNNVYRILVVLFATAIAVFGFSLNPGRGLDLARLHNYVMSVDFRGDNIVWAIINARGVMGGEEIRGMLSFNLLCYIIQLLGNVHWLSAISTFITFSVLLSVLVDFVIDKHYSSKAVAIGIMLIFMGLQIQYVFSGIRNAIAVTLTILAIYLLVYKKHIFSSFILYIMAITMHPSVLIVLVPLIFANKKHQFLYRGIALFTLPGIFFIAEIIRNSPISYFQYLGNRIAFYQVVQYQYDRPEMIANIAVFLAVSLSFWYMKKQSALIISSKLETLYLNAYYLLGCAMIGCAVHRDFTIRIGYLMGIAAIPPVCRILFKRNANKKETRYIPILLVTSITVCCMKVYFDSFLAIFQWSF